jgi:hypothetical protein
VIEIPHIVAHRGASIEAPENTIAAFRVAGARQAKWIECDVTLSADNQCVLIHDDTLERTTNGTGPIHKQPLSVLRELDAGSWFSDIYKGERIPTLNDTLETLFFMDMGANLEIKPSGCQVLMTVPLPKSGGFCPTCRVAGFWRHYPTIGMTDIPSLAQVRFISITRHLIPKRPLKSLRPTCRWSVIPSMIRPVPKSYLAGG